MRNVQQALNDFNQLSQQHGLHYRLPFDQAHLNVFYPLPPPPPPPQVLAGQNELPQGQVPGEQALIVQPAGVGAGGVLLLMIKLVAVLLQMVGLLMIKLVVVLLLMVVLLMIQLLMVKFLVNKAHIIRVRVQSHSLEMSVGRPIMDTGHRTTPTEDTPRKIREPGMVHHHFLKD